MMVTCHCKMFESSTKPAEKPSIGFRVKSVSCFKRSSRITPHRQRGVSSRKGKKKHHQFANDAVREKKRDDDFPPPPRRCVRCTSSSSSSRTKKQDFGNTRLRSSHLSVGFAAKSPLDCSFEARSLSFLFDDADADDEDESEKGPPRKGIK